MSKHNVLIVDDAPFIRDILKHILQKAGFEVVGEAEDGVQAIAMALKTKPDLIIMDIVMPNKSGIQATIEILAELPKTKIIACSTVDQEIMMMKAMEAGAIEFIHKPFHAKEIVRIINQVIENKSGGST